jgi:hypothetical protein
VADGGLVALRSFATHEIPTAAPASRAGLNVGPILRIAEQCRSRWCWAAVAHSVAVRYGRSRHTSQGELAFEVLRTVYGRDDLTQQDCSSSICDPLAEGACSISIDRIPLDVAGISAKPVHGPVRAEILNKELSEGRAVPIFINWRNSPGSHAIAIVGGIASADGITKYFIGDPQTAAPPPHTYEQLISGYRGHGVWARSYLLNE